MVFETSKTLIVFLENATFIVVRSFRYSFENRKSCFVNQERVSDSGTLKNLV
jgi:hypothetical protein